MQIEIEELIRLAKAMERIHLPRAADIDESIVCGGGSRIKIVVLQRGHVVVGTYARHGDEILVTKASVVRRWGTTKGLGELASLGPRTETVLDPCGDVRSPYLGIVLTIDCVDSAWEGKL